VIYEEVEVGKEIKDRVHKKTDCGIDMFPEWKTIKFRSRHWNGVQ
jgi:hypothetical protein